MMEMASAEPEANFGEAFETSASHSRFFSAIQAVAAAIFIVAAPVLLVTTVVRVLVSDVGFYERGLRTHGAEARTGVPLSELDLAAGDIVNYFENDARRLGVVVVVDGKERDLFSERELLHMRDVKRLVRLLFTVQEAALVYTMAYVAGVFLWARERSLRALAWQALAGMGLGLALVITVGAFAATGFDSTWTKFHEVAFQNDLWRLDPGRDALVQMFPEAFWEEAAMLAGAASAAGAAAICAMAGGFLIWSRGARSSAAG